MVLVAYFTRDTAIAAIALLGILAHLTLRFPLGAPDTQYSLPLLAALLLGGVPQVWMVIRRVLSGRFDADILANPPYQRSASIPADASRPSSFAEVSNLPRPFPVTCTTPLVSLASMPIEFLTGRTPPLPPIDRLTQT